MAASSLTAVTTESAPAAEVYDLGRSQESGVERVRRLQREAQLLAHEQIEVLAGDIEALAARAAEIAEGGDAYPAGVRDLAARLAEDLPQKAQTMLIIAGRLAQA